MEVQVRVVASQALLDSYKGRKVMQRPRAPKQVGSGS